MVVVVYKNILHGYGTFSINSLLGWARVGFFGFGVVFLLPEPDPIWMASQLVGYPIVSGSGLGTL